MEKILVSKCLLGELCRWDALRLERGIAERLNGFEIFTICPELEGGLPCPRPRAEIEHGGGYDVLDGLAKVRDDRGRDVTLSFLRGAQSALNLALNHAIKKALLQEKSPSCGVKVIYIDRQLGPGTGVTTSLLKRHGVEVISSG